MNQIFEKIFFYLITALFLFLGMISKLIGRKTRTAFGRLVGRIMMILNKERKLITFSNIEAAFPGNDRLFVKKIARESYENLGITFLELLKMKNTDGSQLKKIVSFKNFELIDEIYSRGKGLILLSGHFGNWELIAYSVGLFSKIPVTVIVKPQKNYVADRFLNKIRTSGGNKIVSMYNAARTMINVINKHEAVGLLADQSGTMDKDIFIKFFDRYASVYEAPAALALRYRVPIIMGFAIRSEPGKYEVELKEIQMDDLNSDHDGILELTKRHTAELENAIRKNPGHWAWQHRRWKHEQVALRQNETIPD